MRKTVKPEESTVAQTETVPPYKVILHNDPITPMDFVVETLTRFFVPDREAAVRLMHAAHMDGIALVGIMPLERAEFKVQMAHEYARANGFPLTFSVEPA
jgi:ATP-dependent Clp protease adaptor protein ClpS